MSSADFFQNQLFEKILLGIPSECQTVWTLIRPDDSSGLIWVQTVCQGYQQTTLVDKELKDYLQKLKFAELMIIYTIVPLITDDDEDDPLLMVDPDPLTVPDRCDDILEQKTQKNCLGSYLQALLYHYLALPFIKVRWVIIGK